LTLQIYR